MSPKIKICKESNCVSEQTAQGFCRLHYLKNWKKIRTDKKKKSLRSLNNYIENIMKRSPENYVDTLKEGLRGGSGDSEVNFSSHFSKDDFETVLEDLGYKEDLDRLLDNIKVDKDF
jgi:hypothetical protein